MLTQAQITAHWAISNANIIRECETMPGYLEYKLACKCIINNCNHMEGINICPVIKLDRCLRLGELDNYYVVQPFVSEYGFTLFWHCKHCNAELCCGISAI